MASFSFHGYLQKNGKDEPFSIQFEANTDSEARGMFTSLVSNVDKWCQKTPNLNTKDMIGTIELNDEDLFGFDNDTYISKMNDTHLTVFDFLSNAVVKDKTGREYYLRDFVYDSNPTCVHRRKIQVRL
jgi:xylose isomerase